MILALNDTMFKAVLSNMKNHLQNMIIVSDFLRSYMLTVLLEKCTYIQIKDTLHIIFQTNDIDICRRPYT